MVIIESVLGNIGDPGWSDRLSNASVELLELDQWEAQKNRFRKTTAKGTELAVALDRVDLFSSLLIALVAQLAVSGFTLRTFRPLRFSES